MALAGAATAQAHRIFGAFGGDADAAWVHQIQWTASSPVPGVTLLSGSFTDAGSHPYWTDTIQAPTTSPFDGSAEVAEAGSFTWAHQIEAALQADGVRATAAVLAWPQYADDPHGAMGVRVRVGDFSTQAAATTEAATLTAD